MYINEKEARENFIDARSSQNVGSLVLDFYALLRGNRHATADFSNV